MFPLNFLDNPVNVTDDDCPTACKNFIHSTTVSVAQVAWERMEGNIPNLEKTMKKIGEQLRNAFEVTTRYHPRYADPKMQLLRRVESTHEEMSKLIETLNSLNLTLPVIPPSVGAHTLLKNFRKFIRSTFEPNVDIIEAALHGMNESFVDGERAFANQTIASLLFGNSSTTIRSLKSLNLPEKVFNLINGRLYMNTFSSFCKNLERVKFGRDHILSEWREGFYVLNGKTIIVGNATDLINRSIDQLMLLIFKKIEYERYGVHGCMQSPMRQFNLTKYASRLSENDNLFDSYLCFNRLFASPNSVASLANQMAHFSEVVPINAVDSDQQTEICNDLLCRVFDDPLNCTITPEEKIKIGILMRSIMPKAFQQCQLAINEARDTFTALSDIYINKILPDYAKMVDLAAGFTANDKKIREMFNRPLWIVTQERQSLVEDVRGYINGSANFSELANAIVTNYSIWLDQNFNVSEKNTKKVFWFYV